MYVDAALSLYKSTLNFQNEVSAVLGLDVRYISIVRDPVELFRSLWDYGNVRLKTDY